MGATLARYAASGVPVTLVTATLGEQGEVMDVARHGGLDADHADQLGGYRLSELQRACRALGIRDRHMLGGLGAFRDSGMAGTPAAQHPRAFHRAQAGGPDHERAVAALTAICARVRPGAILTYDSDGGYGHPDHIAAHQVAVAAVERFYGAGAWGGVHGRAAEPPDTPATSPLTDRVAQPRLWAVVRPAPVLAAALEALWRGPLPAGLTRPEPSDLGGTVAADGFDIAVPVGPWRASRLAAMNAHATQLRAWQGRVDGFTLTNRWAQPLLDHEYFRLLVGPPGGAVPRDIVAPTVPAPSPIAAREHR